MTDSEKLIRIIFSGYNKLAANRDTLDEMNIFPVADADTGSNMTRTMKAAADAVKYEKDNTPEEILKKAAKAMLRSARGNSGVILSVLFKGFSDHVSLNGGLCAENLCGAFENAVKKANEALSKPIYEGTMLSVAAAARDVCKNTSTHDLILLWREITAGTAEAVEKTRYAMAQLKKEPVADSGAQGLFYLILAANEVLSGKIRSIEAESTDVIFKKQSLKTTAVYTYCTEFIINLKKPISVGALETNLEKIGDSIAVVPDDNIVKVHVHTNLPNHALGFALSYGELSDIKIDNMMLTSSLKAGKER